MNILIIGSGGREYTLAWKIAQSPRLNKLYIAPGNGGTTEFGENIKIDILEFEAVSNIIDDKQIDVVLVGPEVPLVAGLKDHILENHPHVTCIGPSKMASRLEGSKSYAKKFMSTYGIPTAAYLEVTKSNLEEGENHIRDSIGPYVLKADGLAAGKGVLIIEDRDEAVQALHKMLEGQFGTASQKVVIEQFLDGIEFSVFVVTDGKTYLRLPDAKDYKRIGEGDTGLNTGGMGAISPVPFIDSQLDDRVIQDIIEPTIEGIRQEGLDYTGFIFFGLIKVGHEPLVIEYNCRLGDPETEAIIPRMETDFLELFNAIKHQELETMNLELKTDTAATVMMVSGGYPGNYKKGYEIHLPEETESLIIHAGTDRQDNSIVTNGGRVIAVTSLAATMKEALKKSYRTAEMINFQDQYYRRDIGFDL